MRLMQSLMQLFCRHEYERVDNSPPPRVEQGELVTITKLHRCKKCKKEKYLGSGWE